MIMKSSTLVLLLSGFIDLSSSQAISQAVKKFYRTADGFRRLRDLISQVNDANEQGIVGRNSYPLPVPRPQYKFKSNDVEYFLPTSMIGSCDSEKIASNSCFCEGKFIMPRSFRNETLDAQAVVAVDPHNRLVVVSYRATASVTNWNTNNDYQLVDYPNLGGNRKVHRGQLRHFLSIHHQMEPIVLQYLAKYTDYTLHVTGYSLGGSISAISLPAWYSAIQSRRMPNTIQLFDYAGPRPGNLEFALYLEALNIPIIRYAKQGDVVPHVPDQSMGYSQVGQEFYNSGSFRGKHDLIKCASNVMEDKECSLGDSNFLAIHHFTPLYKIAPLPPFC